MLKGLEAIEISYEDSILTENETLRFDSEFFRKEFLEKIKNIKNITVNRLEKFAIVKGGKRLSIGDDFSDSGIPYIRAEDVKNSFVRYEDSPFISEITFSKIAAYQTKKDDVLLTIVGNSIGDVGIVKFDLDRCNLTENCVKVVVPFEFRPYLSDYLFLFFMSHYGQFQIEREKVGTAQPKLAIERIRRFLVPAVSRTFQIKLSNTVKCANNRITSSRNIQTEAETLLLDTLGMANFSPSAEAINIKSFKDSFAATGRLDAEYYQPKYEDYQVHVQSYPHGWLPLMQACGLKDDNFTPDEATAYQYIELADIDTAGGIAGCTEAVGGDLPSRARRKVEVGDVLVSSVEGSLSSCAIVPSVMDGALCSTGFYVVRSNKINAETLLVLFKSPLMQNLLKQGCSGTILTAINKAEFQNIPIPIIEAGAQSKIAALIKESFTLKAGSEHLLESAKRAVEIAIEQSEEAALDYLALAQKE